VLSAALNVSEGGAAMMGWSNDHAEGDPLVRPKRINKHGNAR
jgi:hypothetical protein